MTLKLLGAGIALSALLALAVLPAFLSSPAPPGRSCSAGGDPSVEAIMATIRTLESGGDYRARAPGSSASGAYQFLDDSWAGYGGYARAYLAPPAVQDAKAAELIATVLKAHDNDVTTIPVAWYIGHVPPAGSPEWDIVPAPGVGNRLTPREYQTRWMQTYVEQLAGLRDRAGTSTPIGTTVAPAGCGAGPSGSVLEGGWALPGPKDLLDRTADQIDNPHHGHPAWDWAIPVGTPIYAIRGGTVIATTNSPYNCAGRTGCDPCGLGVTTADEQNVQWIYCHGSAQHVRRGDTVTAGQHILDSGNTGHSTGPHLHLGIRVDGVDRCPQPLIGSLHRLGVPVDPTALPAAGCVAGATDG